MPMSQVADVAALDAPRQRPVEAALAPTMVPS